MTTIAYRDGLMAADTQLTIGGHIRTKSDPKIVTLSNGLVLGAAGKTHKIVIATEFLKNPYWIENLDKMPNPETTKGWEGIAAWKGTVYFFQGDCIPNLMVSPFYAIGSGWELAHAAMAMGLSAPDAVKFASELDVYTNAEVQIVNVQQEQEAQAPPKRVRRKTKASV